MEPSTPAADPGNRTPFGRDLLEVRPDGSGRWSGLARTTWARPGSEAGQMLGQAIMAARQQAPGRRVVSANLVFFRPAEAGGEPFCFTLSAFSAGPHLTALDVEVDQGGQLRAAGMLLLSTSPPDRRRGPATVPVPRLDDWFRLPDDPMLHAGLLAHHTAQLAVRAALADPGGRRVPGEINAISIQLHAEVHLDRGLTYHPVSTASGDGLAHTEVRVLTGSGEPVASLSVEALPLGLVGERTVTPA